MCTHVADKLPGFLVTQVTAKDSDADQQLEIQFREPIQAFNPSGVEVTDRRLFQVNLTDISGIQLHLQS